MYCKDCDFTTDVVYDAAAHSYALGHQTVSGPKPGWYVVNHFKDDEVVRGPFMTSEAAGAVRTEIERAHGHDEDWNESHNLWISEGLMRS